MVTTQLACMADKLTYISLNVYQSSIDHASVPYRSALTPEVEIHDLSKRPSPQLTRPTTLLSSPTMSRMLFPKSSLHDSQSSRKHMSSVSHSRNVTFQEWTISQIVFCKDCIICMGSKPRDTSSTPKSLKPITRTTSVYFSGTLLN